VFFPPLSLSFFGLGGARFDASQYAFFGNDVVEEIDLGGLEDEEDKFNNIGLSGIDEEFRPSYSGDNLEVCLLFIFHLHCTSFASFC
jgi:hypothetical protein